MNIQNLIRERVIGNIKIGKKNEKGIPEKLPHFNVEEDKSTRSEIVDIFKQAYPNKPTKLKIRFTSENPFNFKFKRYVKEGNSSKVVCIGNGTKAITVGKDAKGNNTQIEVECNEACEHLKSGKCKLKGSLKFVLDGIEAGGVWNLNTSGGVSLSNIASEIVKHKKAGMSIVDAPFELTLTEQQSLAYGTYYSIDLHRTDIKPQLIEETKPKINSVNETKQLAEGLKEERKETKKTRTNTLEKENKVDETKVEKVKTEDTTKTEDFSNYLTVKKFMPTLINGHKFNKIIFEDINRQDVEFILHPKANQDIMKCGIATLIEMKESKMEMDKNILCKYEIKKVVNPDGTFEEVNNGEELKKAV